MRSNKEHYLPLYLIRHRQNNGTQSGNEEEEHEGEQLVDAS